ncbi:MAG: CPBP family intramembrane metalloprotease [Planctomycetes bacterium]|jgi:membrane protease YdiL (CAAX protease family)|nr:CPBP family intramembrane metalloprotease [Planctomycetota bacterium]
MEPEALDDRSAGGAGAEAAPGPLLGVFALSTVGFFLASAPLSKALGPVAGPAASEVLFFAALPAAALGFLRAPPGSLRIGWPRRGTRLESVLLPALAVFLFLQYQEVQETFLYRSQERLEALYRGIYQVETVSPALLILGVAVVPALCEEFLFRGVLLGALRPVLGAPGAVAASAALFAAVHVHVLVLLPIFFLGLLLGAVTVATKSLVPAVAAHLLNNALVAALLLWPSTGGFWEEIPAGPLLFACSLAAVAAVLWIAVKRARALDSHP